MKTESRLHCRILIVSRGTVQITRGAIIVIEDRFHLDLQLVNLINENNHQKKTCYLIHEKPHRNNHPISLRTTTRNGRGASNKHITIKLQLDIKNHITLNSYSTLKHLSPSRHRYFRRQKPISRNRSTIAPSKTLISGKSIFALKMPNGHSLPKLLS